MSVEAQVLYCSEEAHIVAAGTLSSGQVVQLADGRAGVVPGSGVTYASGDKVSLITAGIMRLAKTASAVILDGGCVYWDRSANKATVIPALAQNDFYLGTAVGDSSSSATTVDVALNAMPAGIMVGGPGQIWTHATTLTAGAPLAEVLGNAIRLVLDATNEAQMAAVYPLDTIPIAQTPIFEAIIHIVAMAGSSTDLNVGVATGGHASDFQSVTEFVTVQLDGGDSAINVTSDDGTTDTAPADSTANWAAGTAFHVAIDCRTTSACAVYINGTADASAADLALDDGSGPWLPIAHVEKSSSTNTAEIIVPFMNLRPGVL